jgi:hypothetical protein
MHPGPINRGIEIASEIADGSRTLILDQVTNGVAVRMAVLYLLAGGSRTEVDSDKITPADDGGRTGAKNGKANGTRKRKESKG